MNFEYMPELKLPNAYLVSLGEMGLIMAVRTEAIAPTGCYEPLTCRSFDRNDESVMGKIRVVDCRIPDDRSWDGPAGRGIEPITGRSTAGLRCKLPVVLAAEKRIANPSADSAVQQTSGGNR
jgi:hypothetical protein